MFDLKGKVALVTGAASGIGFALVKQLLRNELKGVALVDSNVNLGQTALGSLTSVYGNNRVIFIQTDISKQDQLEGAFEAAVKVFKQLDIVINNAGIIHELQWEKCVVVNLSGVILGSNLAIEKYLPKYRSGSEAVILNTASVVGVEPLPALPVYTSTKAAVIGYTRAMGHESHYKVTKIRVVAICPGLTNTSMPNCLTHQQVAEPFFTQFFASMQTCPRQEPEDVAKETMEVIRCAPSGSVWLVDDKKRSEIQSSTLYNW